MNVLANLILDKEISTVDVELLATLFDYARDVAFFVKDKHGRYIAVNDSLAKRHGRSDKLEIIGRRPCDICEGDLGKLPFQQDEQVLNTGRPLIEHLEIQWNRPNDPVWCLTTKLPIKNDQGEVVGIIGFSRDLTMPVNLADVPNQFATAIEEFEETLSAVVTPAWLARQSRLSPQQLARLTKRLFCVTPTQFITKIRIAAACRMLSNTGNSVANIAFDCGYCDHSAFTRSFRSTIGITPTAFRGGKK